jgi:hypothetical protein
MDVKLFAPDTIELSTAASILYRLEAEGRR